MSAKIMIVDDNEKNLEILNDFVESWGYKTILAKQGREALDLARKENPDLVLLDIMLPGVSGFEVCKLLRENQKLGDIPIVLVTALNSIEDRMNGFHVGADNFLVKPVAYKELKIIIKNLLHKRNQYLYFEQQEIVLEKINKLLKKIYLIDDTQVDKAEKKFIDDILQKLCEDKESLLKVKNAIEFYPLRKIIQEKDGSDRFFEDTLAGLSAKGWLMHLINLIEQYETKRFELTDQDEFRISMISWGMLSFKKLLDKYNGNYEKANQEFSIKKDDNEIIKDVKKSIFEEIKKREIRSNIKDHLYKKLKM